MCFLFGLASAVSYYPATQLKKSQPALGYMFLLLFIQFLHKCGKIYLVEEKQLGSHNVIIFNYIFKTMKLIQLFFQIQIADFSSEGQERH